MAGNVGEIRPNHFHTGIDIKASKGEGSPISATAGGYVSRIAVSPSGYGNALYMTHPDGTVSVYAHLDRFIPEIQQWVRKQQYAKKSFPVDLYPPRDMFVFSAGDKIAFLGNSGSSGGPHLHFEIRDAASGSPINLISRGIFEVPDGIPPELHKIYYVEADTVMGVPVFRTAQTISVTRAPEGGLTLSSPVILASKRGYLAYEVIDFKDGRTNTMGVYSIEQKIDGKTNFSFSLDRISFATTRYINTFVDYPLNRKSKFNVLRAYVSPNNALSVYRGITDRGIVTPPAEGTQVPVETIIRDDAGNETIIEFVIEGVPSAAEAPATPPDAAVVPWNRDFSCGDSTFSVTIPQKALYESTLLVISRNAVDGSVTVDAPDVPLQKAVTIKIFGEMPESMRPKALLASVGGSGKLSSAGGQWAGDGVEAETRSLGRFTIAYDTIPPVIAPVGLSGKRVRFKITDDLSGIKSYEINIDEQWELAEYDPKNNMLSTTVAPAETAVPHIVEVTVGDSKDNITRLKREFSW